MLTRLSKHDFTETACLHDSPEDCAMYLLASCPAWSRANAVLAILPVHAQPVQGVRAQQAQRMHHRNAHIYMALVPSGVPQDQLWIWLAGPGERDFCGTHAGVLPVDNASTVMPKTAGCAGKENWESAGGEGLHSHIKNSRKAL